MPGALAKESAASSGMHAAENLRRTSRPVSRAIRFGNGGSAPLSQDFQCMRAPSFGPAAVSRNGNIDRYDRILSAADDLTFDMARYCCHARCHVNSATTRCCRCLPSSARWSASRSRRRSASSRARSSSASTNIPTFAELRISGMPPTLEATTGIPKNLLRARRWADLPNAKERQTPLPFPERQHFRMWHIHVKTNTPCSSKAVTSD